MRGTITVEDLKRMQEEVAFHRLQSNPLFDMFQRPLGMRVIEEPPPPPKLKLSEKVQVSDEFRRAFDIWLAAEFGYRDPRILHNRFYVSTQFGTIIAPPGGAAVLSTIG